MTAGDWVADGHSVALATVVQTWGSAPRPAGAMMVVRGDGLFDGSVSGGCVEGEVIVAAQECLATGKAVQLDYGVSQQTAWTAGLACGGKISILVDAPPAERITHWAATIAEKTPLCRIVRLADGIDLDAQQPDLAHTVQECLRRDKAMVDDQGRFFVPVNPPLSLILVGAVHIAQSLAPMAQALGYGVTVIDPRGLFAQSDRFAGVAMIEDWPDEVLATQPPDRRTAVITLTHDPKLDDAALAAALRSPAFYIGSLGSKKTHAVRLQRLADAGFSADDLARLHGPLGLAIGAASPGEIAISALAQMTQVLRS